MVTFDNPRKTHTDRVTNSIMRCYFPTATNTFQCVPHGLKPHGREDVQWTRLIKSFSGNAGVVILSSGACFFFAFSILLIFPFWLGRSFYSRATARPYWTTARGHESIYKCPLALGVIGGRSGFCWVAFRLKIFFYWLQFLVLFRGRTALWCRGSYLPLSVDSGFFYPNDTLS